MKKFLKCFAIFTIVFYWISVIFAAISAVKKEKIKAKMRCGADCIGIEIEDADYEYDDVEQFLFKKSRKK